MGGWYGYDCSVGERWSQRIQRSWSDWAEKALRVRNAANGVAVEDGASGGSYRRWTLQNHCMTRCNRLLGLALAHWRQSSGLAAPSLLPGGHSGQTSGFA